VIDDFNWEGLGIEVDFSLPAQWVIRSLNQIIELRDKPLSKRDNGPGYVSFTLMTWSEEGGHRFDLYPVRQAHAARLGV
jgi:putative transposase